MMLREGSDAISYRYWFALRTRAQHEKLVRDRLSRQGLQQILPTRTRFSQWTDRKKLIEMPLFPGYCFARFSAHERLSVLQVPGVLYVVGSGGRPEPIPYEEIEALRRLTESGLTYEPYASLTEGMPVEIIRGPLLGVRGRLIRMDRHYHVIIGVELIQQGATVRIGINDVSPIEDPVRTDRTRASSPLLLT